MIVVSHRALCKVCSSNGRYPAISRVRLQSAFQNAVLHLINFSCTGFAIRKRSFLIENFEILNFYVNHLKFNNCWSNLIEIRDHLSCVSEEVSNWNHFSSRLFSLFEIHSLEFNAFISAFGLLNPLLEFDWLGAAADLIREERFPKFTL